MNGRMVDIRKTYTTRYDVLRNGVRVAELLALTPASIDFQSAGEIPVSMSAVFRDDERVDWLQDEIQPIQIIDGVESPVAVFIPATFRQETDDNGAASIRVEAYDRCYRLRSTTTQSRLHFSAGTPYLQAVKELLADAGIVLYIETPSTLSLATDREDWPIGTSYLTIINALLSEINYDSISFDPTGAAVLRPSRTPSAANVDHEYRSGFGVLARQTMRETDAFDAPNVFIVICSNPDYDEPLVAISVNDNPGSKLSTVSRGRKITRVTQVSNIAEQQSLQDYADRLKMESMLSLETATIYTDNLPGHGVRDVVALWHPDLSGIYLETGWNMVLEPGQRMTHTLQKEVLL